DAAADREEEKATADGPLVHEVVERLSVDGCEPDERVARREIQPALPDGLRALAEDGAWKPGTQHGHVDRRVIPVDNTRAGRCDRIRVRHRCCQDGPDWSEAQSRK